MAGGTVNLEAMIKREDFEAETGEPEQTKAGNELYITSLTSEGRLASMRKPEFQRETSAWSPPVIAEFIRSVVDGDVVPAVIMWRSPRSGKIFVIDGAHRLSALIAWIADDYGDRELSQPFAGFQIEQAQLDAAKITRTLVERAVGTYKQIRAYSKAPDSAPSQKELRRSNTLMNNPIYIQWIPGDADAAERSFVRINSTAVAIDATEKLLIHTRKKPSGLAARALMRAGTGYEYWSKFSEPTKGAIRALSKEIYDQLIKPIVEYPIVALDLPAPDRGYSASSAKTVYDLVEYLNPSAGHQSRSKKPVDDDTDGLLTIQYLTNVKAKTSRVFGRYHSGSLALHPGIYCYGATGKFIPKAFIGAVAFVSGLEARDKFFSFTSHRAKFEQFLLNNRTFINQIGSSQGSGGKRGIPAVLELYNLIFEHLAKGVDFDGIIAAIRAHPSLKFLEAAEELPENHGKKFRSDDKAAVILRSTLGAELVCPECKARLYRKDRSHDHKERLQDGGKSGETNMQLTHPYCNTGYKEKLAHVRKLGS